ncbi:hypothetical protein JHL18_16895 [Clostridium sp. YIM B02505]|uniref:Uncharacterized protein n=1 Tax=Clostridium yunnanense TaxID=2800325 RepID=A0ABS1ESE0_9CLOT|nr:hypothetical protein [Clostridium yunnanense]MBK1812303.1 hypothetical protein [Clostridium yunnanense]
MIGNFENNMFYGTLAIYFITNLVNTVIMYKCKRRQLKLLFAILPLPILFIYCTANILIFKSIVDISNPPFGTDYSGYFMGLVILAGFLMVVFYVVNIIYMLIFTLHKPYQ